MKRELASNMYTASAYFLGRYFSHLIQIMIIPFSMMTIMFWAIGIDESWDNCFWVFALAFAAGFCFCAQGFFWGLLITDENRVQQANVFMIMCWIASNGCLVNLK